MKCQAPEKVVWDEKRARSIKITTLRTEARGFVGDRSTRTRHPTELMIELDHWPRRDKIDDINDRIAMRLFAKARDTDCVATNARS